MKFFRLVSEVYLHGRLLHMGIDPIDAAWIESVVFREAELGVWLRDDKLDDLIERILGAKTPRGTPISELINAGQLKKLLILE